MRNITIIINCLLLLSANFAYAQSDNQTSDNRATTGTRTPLDDNAVSDAVKWELTMQSGVTSENIHVSTDSGIVTLTGIAGNLLEKERATNIASSIKGVRGVINEIQVEPSKLDDKTIRENIQKSLQEDPALGDREIEVDVKDATVTLGGNLTSWQEKNFVERVAKSTDGVVELNNNIQVKYLGDRSDSDIKSEIEQTLAWDSRVDDGLINTMVDNGKVTLTGTVGSFAEKRRAEENAWVSGVKTVNSNGLVVARWERDKDLVGNKYEKRGDDQIKNAVIKRIKRDPVLRPHNPSVEVKDGIVTLSGSVDNIRAKRAAEANAKDIVGVKKVINQIEISASQDNTRNLEERVKEAITFNPNVNKYDVRVTVDGGSVTLTGYVDSNFEKFQAEKTVESVKGVSNINNNLTVEIDATPFVYDYNYNYYEVYPLGPNNVTTKSNEALMNDITRQLEWSPYVDESDIKVIVDNGYVILEGTVDTWKEYYYVEKNVYEAGATGVDNNLEVRS